MATHPAGPSAAEATQKLRDAAEDAKRFAQGFQDGATELGSALRAEIGEHPYRTVLVTAGVGYVLGGGLASALTRRLLRLAMRTLIIPAVSEPLAQIWSSVVGAASEVHGAEGGASQPK